MTYNDKQARPFFPYMTNFSLEHERELELPLETPQEAIEVLSKLRSRERRPEIKLEEKIEHILKALPRVERERIRNFLIERREKLERYGTSKEGIDEILIEDADERARLFHQGFEDKRFHVGGEKESLPNDEYSKVRIIEMLDELVAKEAKSVDFEKIARLWFDTNGLKAVNDFAGHTQGTEYLRRIVEVLWHPQGKTRKWLQEQGIEVILVTTGHGGGGDEFGLLLEGKQAIKSEIIREAIRRFENEVKETVNTSDLLNFFNPAVLKKSGFSKEQIPKDFKFPATICGSGETLLKGLEWALKRASGDKRLRRTDTYQKALQNIMGGVVDAANEALAERKSLFREGLSKSSNSADRFYAEILRKIGR